MFINIVTPTKDGENLELIYKSINIPEQNYRWIIIFDSENQAYFPKIRNAEFYSTKNAKSISGNAQRNFGLSKVNSGFVLFLDDDTLLHPLFWESVKDLSYNLDFISFDQSWNTHGNADYTKTNIINNNKVIRTKGDYPELDHIDSGNYIVNFRIAEQLRWQLESYNADGLFCVECFNLSRERVYIPKILSIYNLLDKKRAYNIPFEKGWVTPQGIFYNVDDSYYDYLRPKYEHIYHQEQFGEPWFRNEKLYSDIVEKSSDPAIFVEVGCWKGKSSAYMAVDIANSGKNIQFYCVDTWAGSKEHIFAENEVDRLWTIFNTNMLTLRQFYSAIRMESITASYLFKAESIDFVYIDASHEYEDVKNDIIHWLPKVKKGGIIAGDDYGNPDFPGVHKAVFELLDTYEVKQGTWIFKK